MFALPCSYVPKHAAPREPLAPQTRNVLALGLAAAVLPLSAAPALADSAPAAETSTTSSTATQSAPAADSTPATEATPASDTTAAAPAAEAAPASDSSSTTATRSKPETRERSDSALVLRAPAQVRSSRVKVGVRLTSGGRGVRNGYVRLEKSTGEGWTYVGRLLTNDDGVGAGTLPVAGSARLRAAYTGSDVRTPAVSAARTVRSSEKARTTEDDGDSVLQVAAQYVGTPYRYGATGPDAFDCSGYTRYVYGRLGVSLPHSSSAQRDVATPVSRADARPGDLVFIPGHVGIYAGGGRMYDAPGSGRSVVLRDIYTSNYTLGRVR